jgi:hypothetical protein
MHRPIYVQLYVNYTAWEKTKFPEIQLSVCFGTASDTCPRAFLVVCCSIACRWGPLPVPFSSMKIDPRRPNHTSKSSPSSVVRLTWGACTVGTSSTTKRLELGGLSAARASLSGDWHGVTGSTWAASHSRWTTCWDYYIHTVIIISIREPRIWRTWKIKLLIYTSCKLSYGQQLIRCYAACDDHCHRRASYEAV